MIPVLHGVWASGGLAGDFEHIETQTVGAGGAASVTFSSIPQTYKHLQVRLIARTTRATISDTLAFRVNGDSGSNYSQHGLIGDGSTATSVGAASQTATNMTRVAAASAALPVMFGAGVVDFLDYSMTTKNKTIRSLGGFDDNASTVWSQIRFDSSVWLSTAAITSVTVAGGTGNLVQYSTFSLYGVK